MATALQHDLSALIARIPSTRTRGRHPRARTPSLQQALNQHSNRTTRWETVTLFMLPTYFLPYVGSNAIVANSAMGGGLASFFYAHLFVLIFLCILALCRGTLVSKQWLVVFPIIALIFDLTPLLSSIPLVPTAMHIAALIVGVSSTRNVPHIAQSAV